MENHSFIKFVPGIYVIYLSVPKVASSSISYEMLNRQPTASPDMSEHSREGKALTNWRSIDSPHPTLPIFTFTRHPIKKFVSYYKDKFVRARGQGFELDHLKKLNFDPEMSLEEVVRHMMTIPVEKMEHHAQPQYRILIKNGRLIPDFVGKVENILNEWHLIREVSLCDFLIKNNKNTTDNQAAALDLSDAVISALTKYYEEDFELFGYDKSPANDGSINVSRPRVCLSVDEVKRYKYEIKSKRLEFQELADRLKSEPDFKDNYYNARKQDFNKFLIFKNNSSLIYPSRFLKIKHFLKNNFIL